MTTGELMSLIIYSLQILGNLMMFSMFFVILTISGTSAKRIVELLDEVPDIKNKKDAIKKVENGKIEFKNVKFVSRLYRDPHMSRGNKTKQKTDMLE